jgi:hypothetical protein
MNQISRSIACPASALVMLAGSAIAPMPSGLFLALFADASQKQRYCNQT